jgi:hypothetical protein
LIVGRALTKNCQKHDRNSNNTKKTTSMFTLKPPNIICQLADQAQAHSFGRLAVMNTPSYLMPFPAAVIHSYWCLRSTVGSVALKISKSDNEIRFISPIVNSAYLSLVKVCPTAGGSRIKASRNCIFPNLTLSKLNH